MPKWHNRRVAPDVHLAATFLGIVHSASRSFQQAASHMKTIFTLVLALIPLAAVASACVVCP
jgi:hypothetical protein